MVFGFPAGIFRVEKMGWVVTRVQSGVVEDQLFGVKTLDTGFLQTLPDRCGLGRLAGKVFRIGHLGDFNDLSLIGTLGGVEMGLAAAGIPHQAGGVEVAMAHLTGADQLVGASATR